MHYSTSVEEVEGRWVAFVPALLGCFASAETRDAAISSLPAAVRAYAIWRQGKGDAFSLDARHTFDLDEIVREWSDPAHPDYMVSAFFAADAPPLTSADIGLALDLLAWAYADLLAAGGVPEDKLDQPVENDWSIAAILNHCSRAEWWYLDRLGYSPPAGKEPDRWRERLAMAHQQLVSVLPTLEGVARIELKDCELWSPRKMLRRALWHERDHTQHIRQFRSRLGL